MAGKAISREDLIFILQGIFKRSAAADNGFQLLDDGFFVKDYGNELALHTGNSDIHIDNVTREILNKISVNSEGIIMYDGQFAARISDAADNALSMKQDGLWAQDQSKNISDINKEITDIKNGADSHYYDGDIHVTPQDKANWDSARQAARDEANQQIQKLTLYDFQMVNNLPAFDDAKESTIYMLHDPNYIKGLLFTLWVKLPDKWQQVNMPMDIYNDLMKVSKLNEVLQQFIDNNFHEHANLAVLDKIEEQNGGLVYNGKQVSGVDYLEVRDLINSIRNATSLGVQKKILYRGKMGNSGKYQLNEDIERFAFVIIDFRTDYSDGSAPDGSCKSVTIDPDTLAELYDESLDYMLELGHGTSFAETRINARGDQFYVNYWNHLTIYKITGYGEKEEVDEDGGESS